MESTEPHSGLIQIAVERFGSNVKLVLMVRFVARSCQMFRQQNGLVRFKTSSRTIKLLVTWFGSVSCIFSCND